MGCDRGRVAEWSGSPLFALEGLGCRFKSQGGRTKTRSLETGSAMGKKEEKKEKIGVPPPPKKKSRRADPGLQT